MNASSQSFFPIVCRVLQWCLSLLRKMLVGSPLSTMQLKKETSRYGEMTDSSYQGNVLDELPWPFSYGMPQGYTSWSIYIYRASKSTLLIVWCWTLLISVELGTFCRQKQDSCNCDVRFLGHAHTRGRQVTITHLPEIREIKQWWWSGRVIFTSIDF